MTPTCDHAGRALGQELNRRGLTVAMLARAIGTSRDQVAHIVRSRRAITAPMALRIGKALGMDAREWLARQAAWDIQQVFEQQGDAVARIQPLVHRETVGVLEARLNRTPAGDGRDRLCRVLDSLSRDVADDDLYAAIVDGPRTEDASPAPAGA